MLRAIKRSDTFNLHNAPYAPYAPMLSLAPSAMHKNQNADCETHAAARMDVVHVCLRYVSEAE